MRMRSPGWADDCLCVEFYRRGKRSGSLRLPLPASLNSLPPFPATESVERPTASESTRAVGDVCGGHGRKLHPLTR